MNKHYVVVETEDQLDEMRNHILDSEFIAYDTETTGLNVRKDKVIGFSVSGSEGIGYYLPILKYQNRELVPATNFPHCATLEILNLLKFKKLIMFNASYDVRITRNDLEIDLIDALYADAMLLKHTCDEEFPFGLKDIAKKIQDKLGLDVEEEANKEQLEMIASIKANGGSTTRESYELYKADMHKIGIYACADTDLTLRVFNYYSEQLAKEGLENFFYKDEVMPLYKTVTIPMESKGIPINVAMIEQAKSEITEDIKAIEEDIQGKISPYLDTFYDWYLNKEFPPQPSGSFAQAICAYADLDLPQTKSGRYSLTKSNVEALEPSFYKDFLLHGHNCPLEDDVVRSIQLSMVDGYAFNISSKHHLSKLFFDTLEEKSVTKTPTGKPQMNDLFLDSIADKYDFVPLIRIYNKLNKLKSAYMDRFLEKQEDGIFYPSFQQHRTISGRYGSDLQQLPRPFESDKGIDSRVYKYTNMIRQFFISGDGYVFIDADYESLEPHVFAHISGDEGLKDIFRNGHDFYSTIAIRTEGLEGVSADKSADNYLGLLDKPKRQDAKAYALGIPYGMEAFLLGKTLDIPQQKAEKLIKGYLDGFPKLKDWMERSNESCKLYGKARSEAGRVRHMKLAAGIFHSERKTLFDSEGNLKDSLLLWKEWNGHPKKYQNYKWKRKKMKNFLNNAKNFQIQSLAASITNRACIAIARELKRQRSTGYICAQVHDQIVVRVPESEAHKWQKIVQYLMENTYKISLPLKAPAEIGKNLQEAH